LFGTIDAWRNAFERAQQHTQDLQELIQTQHEHLKVQQEKQRPTFQLLMDKEKFIDRK
jgi:hypothetical protein